MRRERAHSRLGDAGAASCPARITPSRVLAHRTSAPHGGPRTRLVRAHGLDVARDGPPKPDERARDRHDRTPWPLPIRQVVESRMQALLRLPGVRDHRGRLPLMPALEVDARLRSMPVAPRRLSEHMATVVIPRLGDGAESLSRAARVFAGDEPKIAGELPRSLEAAPIHQFGRQHPSPSAARSRESIGASQPSA